MVISASQQSAEMMNITCIATGNPLPSSIVWQHLGVNLSENYVSVVDGNFSSFQSRISILEIEVTDDYELYICIASTVYAGITCTANTTFVYNGGK